MNYIAFQNTFQHRKIIPVNDIIKLFPEFDTSLLVDWQKKGYIQKIINRYYAWANTPFSEEQLFFTANKIYPSSYISLKSALRWYNFIPEGVYQYFSVSTRKTKVFDTPVGIFSYKHIKPEIFFGYRPVKQMGNQSINGSISQIGSFLIAEPEKAILDTLYLYPYIQDELDIDGLRLNYDMIAESCNITKLQEYAALFENKRVVQLTNIIIKNLSENPQ